jgi:hypothetical protein
MSEVKNQPQDLEPVKLTKKDLINHFLLFRFGGSLIILGIIGLILDFLDRTRPDSGSSLIIGIATVTIINVPIQLFYLLKAFWNYQKQKKVDKT